MARMPSVRGAVIKCQMQNLREMKLRFSDIAKTIDRDTGTQFRSVAIGITKAYALAAQVVRDKARSNASSGNVPRRLHSGSRPAIFAFTDFDATVDKKRSRSSLVGVRTGAPPRKDPRLYVEWGKRGGKRLGMSLARIFESGTRKGIKARRFFRSAVFATRSRVLSILTDAYSEAIRKFNP